MILTAEIRDARLPDGQLTIVATHLEENSKPEGRRKQLEELLARIKDTSGPLVVAGDMNTSTHNGTPLSAERLLKNRLGSKRDRKNKRLNSRDVALSRMLSSA